MRIGGDAAFDRVSRESFARFADEVGMAPAFVLGRLHALADKLMPAATALAGDMNARYPSAVYGKILDIVKDRLARVS